MVNYKFLCVFLASDPFETLLLLVPPFSDYSFLVHYRVNRNDRYLLAHAMASIFIGQLQVYLYINYCLLKKMSKKFSQKVEIL
jgi:hypothetical protein